MELFKKRLLEIPFCCFQIELSAVMFGGISSSEADRHLTE